MTAQSIITKVNKSLYVTISTTPSARLGTGRTVLPAAQVNILCC